jgi:hypothetical protein
MATQPGLIFVRRKLNTDEPFYVAYRDAASASALVMR